MLWVSPSRNAIDLRRRLQLAAGHGAIAVGHGHADRGRREVPHRVLRIPERAVAEQVVRFDREERLAVLRRLACHRNRVDVEILRRQPPVVGHDERQVRVLRHDARERDQQRVLPAHPQVKQRPVFDADHASHLQRLGQAQRDRRHRRAAHPHRQTGAALDELPLRKDRHVHVEVLDVVVAERVVAVEAPARRQLCRRRVERDRLLVLALEQAHVLGLRRRAREGQRVVAARVDFGHEVARRRQQVPVVGAEIAEIHLERPRATNVRIRSGRGAPRVRRWSRPAVAAAPPGPGSRTG